MRLGANDARIHPAFISQSPGFISRAPAFFRSGLQRAPQKLTPPAPPPFGPSGGVFFFSARDVPMAFAEVVRRPSAAGAAVVAGRACPLAPQRPPGEALPIRDVDFLVATDAIGHGPEHGRGTHVRPFAGRA